MWPVTRNIFTLDLILEYLLSKYILIKEEQLWNSAKKNNLTKNFIVYLSFNRIFNSSFTENIRTSQLDESQYFVNENFTGQERIAQCEVESNHGYPFDNA